MSSSNPPTDPEYLRELDRMRPPQEARAIVDSQVTRLPSEEVPLAEASWRILAGDIVAPEDHPTCGSTPATCSLWRGPTATP